MHISSLPSPYGIGTLGRAAYDFADFLERTSQHVWQVLPLSPTGFGDSPYQSFSSFAGNPYFIDLDMLCDDGLLSLGDYDGLNWGSDPARVDYGAIYNNRFPVLRLACAKLTERPVGDFEAFCEKNAFWLEDYSLFMSLKERFGGRSWTQWDEPYRLREPNAIERARWELRSNITFWKAVQYLFFRQWNALHEYCRNKNIEIIGDLPIYVSPDSADIWANPSIFALDENLSPVEVAGCPPDVFTVDGQLWGNPLYNWQALRADGYKWWINRIAQQFSLYDTVRIDHFRGFDSYYCIPSGAENARCGVWRESPGLDLFRAIESALGKKSIIAEDLGYLTDTVRALLRDSGFPGMKVLQFAFDKRDDSDYLPHNFVKNCVGYTGTHDNDTVCGWFETAPEAGRAKALAYMRVGQYESPVRAMLATLWASVADLAITTMQDVLELGSEARMNIPGTCGGNWQWRMTPDSLKSEQAEYLAYITQLYSRA